MTLSKRSFLKSALGCAALAGAGTVPARVRAAPSDEMLTTNVRVFDGKGDSLSDPTNVLIRGEMIAEIAPNAEAPPEARHIDGGGRTLMPGLIDTHTHLQWNQGPQQLIAERPGYATALTFKECEATLMRGFTSVRDVGGGIWAWPKPWTRGSFRVRASSFPGRPSA